MCNVQTNPGPQLDAHIMAASRWIQTQIHSDQDNYGGKDRFQSGIRYYLDVYNCWIESELSRLKSEEVSLCDCVNDVREH